MSIHSPFSTSPLRFGIVTSRDHLLAWEVECIEQIRTRHDAELAVSLVGIPPPQKIVSQPWSSMAVAKLVTRARAFAKVPVSSLTGTGIQIAPRDPDVEAKMAALAVDFLLVFNADPKRWSRHAKYGAWSFAIGDHPIDETFGSDEVERSQDTSRLRLVGYDANQSYVLREAFYPTVSFSLSRNADSILFDFARAPSQVCTDIRNGLWHSPKPVPQSLAGDASPRPEAAGLGIRLGLNFVKKHYQLLFRHEIWNVGIIRAPIADSIGERTKIEWFPRQGRSKFRADSFGIEHDGRQYILYEDFDYANRIGFISGVELVDGKPTMPQRAISAATHLAYPYLFEHEGAVYCIPETAEQGKIILYKAIELPHRWEQVATLLDGVAGIDSTVFKFEGKWWLFCTLPETGSSLSLHIWHADDLLGPWTPHANNPVKTDVRSARPGGTPIVVDGVLYRPAQDCSHTYGGRVVWNRVQRLNPLEFEEVPAAFVEPDPADPYPRGLHTISALGDITVVDGKRFQLVGEAFRHAMQENWKRVVEKIRFRP